MFPLHEWRNHAYSQVHMWLVFNKICTTRMIGCYFMTCNWQVIIIQSTCCFLASYCDIKGFQGLCRGRDGRLIPKRIQRWYEIYVSYVIRKVFSLNALYHDTANWFSSKDSVKMGCLGKKKNCEFMLGGVTFFCLNPIRKLRYKGAFATEVSICPWNIGQLTVT